MRTYKAAPCMALLYMWIPCGRSYHFLWPVCWLQYCCVAMCLCELIDPDPKVLQPQWVNMKKCVNNQSVFCVHCHSTHHRMMCNIIHHKPGGTLHRVETPPNRHMCFQWYRLMVSRQSLSSRPLGSPL